MKQKLTCKILKRVPKLSGLRKIGSVDTNARILFCMNWKKDILPSLGRKESLLRCLGVTLNIDH